MIDLTSVRRPRLRSTRRAATLTGVAVVAPALLLGLVACAPEPGAAPRATAPSTAEAEAEASPETGPDRESAASPAPAATPQPDAEPARPERSQEEFDAQLRAAAWANDVPAAEQLIAWGANVNAKDSTVQSAYLIATSEGYVPLLQLTLAHGADVADLDSWNGTGLIRAAERGHSAVVGELLQAGVPLDHVNRVGYQAIHESVWFGRDDPSYHATIRVLAAGGVQLQTPSVSEGLTPLQMAEWKGYPGSAATLRAILDAQAPADPAAALLVAAGAGDADGVAVALRAGAAATTVDTEGRTAHQLAAAGGHAAAAQVIRALGG